MPGFAHEVVVPTPHWIAHPRQDEKEKQHDEDHRDHAPYQWANPLALVFIDVDLNLLGFPGTFGRIDFRILFADFRKETVLILDMGQGNRESPTRKFEFLDVLIFGIAHFSLQLGAAGNRQLGNLPFVRERHELVETDVLVAGNKVLKHEQNHEQQSAENECDDKYRACLTIGTRSIGRAWDPGWGHWQSRGSTGN